MDLPARKDLSETYDVMNHEIPRSTNFWIGPAGTATPIFRMQKFRRTNHQGLGTKYAAPGGE